MTFYLNRLRTMDKTTLITMQVTIGKKKDVSPDLKTISPGNLPNGSCLK